MSTHSAKQSLRNNKHLRLIAFAICALLVLAPQAISQTQHEIQFPDIMGYKTLMCDLHMHTIFSDGSVWPTIRVDEAYREGYDAIAITDHIEYKPHKDTVTTGHNDSYGIAQGAAKTMGILFPRAAEITRSTPPGHFNAIFLKDAALLDTEEFVDAIGAANEQGAFVFWNHQAWKGVENGRWRDVHTTIYEKKWLHGVEVYNGDGYHLDAHRWAIEKNLTMLGNTDMHGPSLRKETTADDHRACTLVFAKDKSLEALKEALFAGRTAVWSKDQLVARGEYLSAIFKASVAVAPHQKDDRSIRVKVKNSADIDIKLKRTGTEGPGSIELKADATTMLRINTQSTESELKLQYTVENFLIAPGKGLPVEITIPLR